MTFEPRKLEKNKYKRRYRLDKTDIMALALSTLVIGYVVIRVLIG